MAITQSSISILKRWNMYCPKCGAQAADETKYCRACGQSLTLVSQAMMNPLPADNDDQQKLEKAITNISLGAGFLIISIVIAAIAPPPVNWALCFSVMIAAMVWLSLGVAGILGRAISRSRPTSLVDRAAVKETAPLLGELPSGDAAGELVGLTPPSGVTEVTTRNLEAGAGHLKDK
jgi:zinc-ribbon domain